MSRKAAREAAVRLFYEYAMTGEFNDITPVEMGDVLKTESYVDHGDYVSSLIQNFKEHSADIDKMIRDHLVDWSFERLSKVDLSILRVAVCEMEYLNIPKKVAVCEAVLLAKKYSGEKSYIFVNGVLASVINELEKNAV